MKCAGKELRGEVVAHWKNAASCNAEGGVLEGLEFLDGCGRGFWEPDGGGVKKEGTD